MPVRSLFPDAEHHSWEDDFHLLAKSPGTSVFSANTAWQYLLEEMVQFGTKPYLFPFASFSFLFFFFLTLDKKTASFEEQKKKKKIKFLFLHLLSSQLFIC